MILRLAIKNFFGAGLRTWLNVGALSIVFATILLMQGMYTGLFTKIENDMIHFEVAGGQYWQKNYDPHNFLNVDDSYADYSAFQDKIDLDEAVPILIRSAYLYSDANMQGILLKGIDRNQSLLEMPTHTFNSEPGIISVYMGSIMAKHAHIQEGDNVMIRFRDKHGVNNAIEAEVSHIMHVPIQSIDIGQIWIDLNILQKLTDLENHATIVTVNEPLSRKIGGWDYQGMDVMFADLTAWKMQELSGGYMMMAILLGLVVISVFDTQMLAIFRRKKEIGTLVAIGMRQQGVVWLFTVEGMLYAVFAVIIGAVPGIPFLYYLQKHGINLGSSMEELAMNIANVIYPECSWNVIFTVSAMVFIVVILVSYFAAKRITKMNIVQTLKGK
ncbi:MAG: FtsX-like permease family protein [Candidatus Marinimicrobia bacterium]|nr:FtsX-like permease family protein [Candidatus Neomarinimicrobiota bacterium]